MGFPQIRKHDYIFEDMVMPRPKWWAKLTWKWNIPLKLKCFLWLFLENKILNWDNLHNRGFTRLGICPLCNSNE